VQIGNIPIIVSNVLLVLAGVGGVACSFAAPVGRKALTGIGSALVLAAGIVFLLLWFGPFYETLAGFTDWGVAEIVLGVVEYGFVVGLGVGLVLLAFAATRRLPQPRPRYTPHQPYGPHAPGTPHQYGPSQG
jgi:hypothetical protein